MYKKITDNSVTFWAFGILVFLIIVRILNPSFVELFRLKGFDLYQKFSPRPYSSETNIVIIDIDEQSLESIGQFPWPRNIYAQLVDKAKMADAKVVGFDILFPEPDRSSPSNFIKNYPSMNLDTKQDLLKLPNNDDVFVQSINQINSVVAYSTYYEKLKNNKNNNPQPFINKEEKLKSFIFKFPYLLTNIKKINMAAKGWGTISLIPEKDGIIRRIPSFVEVDNKAYPSFSLELLRVAEKEKEYSFLSTSDGLTNIKLGNLLIPTDKNGRFYLHYQKSNRQKFISFVDVLADDFDLSLLREKIIIVGTSAVGLFDIKKTSIGSNFPGVEIHANAVEMILNQDIPRRPETIISIEIFSIIFISLFFIFLIPRLKARFTLPPLIGILVIFFYIGYFLFNKKNILMDITYPLFSAILIYSFLVFANYFREEKLKHYIRIAFKHYLSPSMVDKLIEKPAKLKLGGQRKEMTFMFCDVRDFTSLAEKINPTVLTKLVNRFLTTMSDIILKHGGTIDKYIGDCIMAFWGAPITDQHHCVHACQASLEMETKLKIFKEKIKKDLEVDNKILRNLSIGIGINTGICVVGNFGTRKRFDYSVLGDSVNLASRLEGQTKIYGIAIIFGEKTKDALEKFAVIELDKIRVKGKQTPEKIYTVLGDDAVKQEKDFKSLLKMQAKFLDSYRNRKWNIAIKFLHKAQRIGKKYGLHQYYNVLKERIALFKKKPPLPGWKGIFNVDIK